MHEGAHLRPQLSEVMLPWPWQVHRWGQGGLGTAGVLSGSPCTAGPREQEFVVDLGCGHAFGGFPSRHVHTCVLYVCVLHLFGHGHS